MLRICYTPPQHHNTKEASESGQGAGEKMRWTRASDTPYLLYPIPSILYPPVPLDPIMAFSASQPKTANAVTDA